MNIASVVGAIASFSWLLVVGVVALVVLRTARGNRVRSAGWLVGGALLLAVLLTTVSQGLVFVQPSEVGVVISALPGQEGIRAEPLTSGLHWIVPYFENVITYSISRQTYTMSIAPLEGQVQGDDSVEARTADGQVVYADASVIYAIDPEEVVTIHKNWQTRYQDELVRPITRGIIRDSISGYGVEEVYGIRRAELEVTITEELTAKLESEGLVLVDFVLRNIAFSNEYAASVEQKQIAEQLAQQAAFVVEQRKQEAEQARQAAQGQADSVAIRAEGDARALVIAAQAEAEARIIQAQAEAEALRLIAEALRDNPDLLTYQYITKLAPNITVMLLPADSPFLFPLPQVGPPSPEVIEVPDVPTPEPTPTSTP